MPQAMKIPDAKAAVLKEWKKLETVPAWQVDKMKSQKDVVMDAPRDRKKGPLCHVRDSVRLQTVLWLCMNKRIFEATNNRGYSRVNTSVTRHIDQGW